ncbi:MAG: PKD domain-containing protein, partial [Bacteroidia bacterium]
MKTARTTIFLVLFSIGLRLIANPVADFSVSSKQGCLPLTVNYTDKSSGGVVSYLWDFGNGNQSTLQNPSAIYYQSGNFKVTLTVTDGNGLKSTKTFSPIRVFKNPSASFTADTVGCIGQKLGYKDASTKADTAITNWTWDFGDGTLSNSQFPSHSYTYAGTFSIGLTVTDGFGCKSLSNRSNYIRIKSSPKADFALDKAYSCTLPGEFNAKNTSTGGGSISWTSSNGGSGSGNDFKTSIGSYGQYSITLIAKGSGCSDTFSRSVLVAKPSPRFKLPQGSICQGAAIEFENQSTPDLPQMKYIWDFGDGTKDSGKSPKHAF